MRVSQNFSLKLDPLIGAEVTNTTTTTLFAHKHFIEHLVDISKKTIMKTRALKKTQTFYPIAQ
jgi:hypothetical protein